MGDAALVIVRAGPLVTVQDRGRRGYGRFGVARSGPMDWSAHALALRLAGCASDRPALEAGPGGLSVRGEGAPIVLGLAGLDGCARVKGARGTRIVPLPARVTLLPDETLDLLPLAGTWTVLAARGLETGPPTLGSRATNARTGLGSERPGEGTRYRCDAATPDHDLPCREPLDAAEGTDAPIRILPAPQTHLFDAGSLERLVGEPFTVSARRDRQGGRLEGPGLHAPAGHDIVSDALVEGAMQVPGDGHPIALTADCAPTGGYPKIAVVIRADLPRLVQRRVGTPLRFAWTSERAAREALFGLEDAIANPTPRRRAPLSAAYLDALPKR